MKGHKNTGKKENNGLKSKKRKYYSARFTSADFIGCSLFCFGRFHRRRCKGSF